MHRKNKSIITKVWISVFSLIFFLGLLESGLRIAGYFYSQGRLRQMDSYFGDSEDTSKRDDLPKFGHLTREESMICGEDPQSKNLPVDNKGGYTILCVGDSYTFGGFGSYEDTYPYQLQKMINAAFSSRITVINGGACEYNSRQVLARLPSLIKDYKPDVVILLVGAANRFNLALYDMNGNTIMGIIRSFRIYKMAKMIKMNFHKNFLMRWKRYSNSPHLTNRPTKDFGIDGYPLGQSMYDRAVKHFEKMSMIKVFPENNDLHATIWFYYNKGDVEKALHLCRRTLKKDSDSVILCDMAHIYHEIGEIEEAKKLYEAAYHDNPESGFVRFHLAYFYHRLSRNESEYGSPEFDRYQTIDTYCKAIQLDPMYDLHAYYNLASTYAYQSKYDAKYILAFFQKMRNENPELMKNKLFVNYYTFFQDQMKWEKKLDEWLEKDLEKITNLCNKSKIKLIIQNYPYPYVATNKILEAVARKRSLPFIDNYMFVSKLARQHSLRVYILDSNHCTPKGHRMIAKNVYDTLASEGIILK